MKAGRRCAPPIGPRRSGRGHGWDNAGPIARAATCGTAPVAVPAPHRAARYNADYKRFSLIQFRSVSKHPPHGEAPPRPFPGRQRPSSPDSQTGGAFASCIVPCVCTFHKRRRAPQRPSVHRIPCVHAHSDLIWARLYALRAYPVRSGAFRPDTGCHLHKSRTQRCFSICTAGAFRSAPPVLFNPHRHNRSPNRPRGAAAAYAAFCGHRRHLAVFFMMAIHLPPECRLHRETSLRPEIPASRCPH